MRSPQLSKKAAQGSLLLSIKYSLLLSFPFFSSFLGTDLSFPFSRFISIMLSKAFLALGTVSLAVLPLSTAYTVTVHNNLQLADTQTLENPTSYDFPLIQNGSLVNSGQFPMPLCNGFKLEEATIDQLQQAMSTSKLTSVQIVLCYLKRIYQVDEYTK